MQRKHPFCKKLRNAFSLHLKTDSKRRQIFSVVQFDSAILQKEHVYIYFGYFGDTD
jgi:hypothetical protein